MARVLRSALAAVAVAAFGAVAAAGGARTAITVWPTPVAGANAFGGATYGNLATPPSGALIVEDREVELAGAELRIGGVAATLDAGSVQLRGLGDAAGLRVVEQRFVPAAITPDEILVRHIGDPVAVVTAKGEVAGVLRAADPQSIVVEVGGGADRRLEVLRRELVQDVKLAGGSGSASATAALVWKLAQPRPGKQTVELAYRADGMAWAADYVAIVDDTASTIDFNAWATVHNATGASFDDAELTLVANAPGSGGAATSDPPAKVSVPRTAAQLRFLAPAHVQLGRGESVQLELIPALRGVKARPIVVYESMQDSSAGYRDTPASDCNMAISVEPHADVVLELDVPNHATLPEGRVRLFRRVHDRLDAIDEDALASSPGLARVRVAPAPELAGERKIVSCTVNEVAHTMREKIELSLDNKGKQEVAAVVREYMWRTPGWRIDPADETVKGARVAPQTVEYRVAVPAGGKRSVAYTVVYQW